MELNWNQLGPKCYIANELEFQRTKYGFEFSKTLELKTK